MHPSQAHKLLQTLKTRFEQNVQRHPALPWAAVEARLEAHPDKLLALFRMEQTGGEPDVVGHDPQTGVLVFYDCSAESPLGRRSLCYDREALEARKQARPRGSAVEMARAMGIELPNEEEYLAFQQLGVFDARTSSWLKTPPAIRKLGGALFGDRRYGRVFVYHNGAGSYFAARGFRGVLRV